MHFLFLNSFAIINFSTLLRKTEAKKHKHKQSIYDSRALGAGRILLNLSLHFLHVGESKQSFLVNNIAPPSPAEIEPN